MKFLILLWMSYSCGESGSILDVAFKSPLKSEFDILVNGVPWLKEDLSQGEILVTANEQSYTTSDQSLQVEKEEPVFQGFDVLGSFSSHLLHWSPSEIGFQTQMRVYENLLVFTQRFQNALNGTSLHSSEVVSTSFPSLVICHQSLGHISFGGNMAGWAALSVAHSWMHPESIRGGQLGGPVAFFDRNYSAVIVLSALNHFMVTNMEVKSHRRLDFGLMGSMESIPEAGVEIEFVMAAGSTFDEAFHRWGQAVQLYHGKRLSGRDVARKYLGYWTDNGAYYYYRTMDGLDYQDTLIQLHHQLRLPVRYLEIDSWWYYKGPFQGVTNWTAMTDLFPNGLDAVQQETGWPIVAHNRYWSGINVYKEAYHFHIESDENNRSIALPLDQRLWDDLFHEAKKWGLEMYEQDWLDVQYLMMNFTRTDFTAAETWLRQMSSGAEKNGLFIKYCMALPRQILSSVLGSAVNAARVSGDYRLSKDNWRLGLSTYLSSALGLATFKDTFWSSRSNPDHPFYYDCMIGQQVDNAPWPVTYRYDGPHSITKSGRQCISWYDLDLHFTAPNNDLERSACRNANFNQFDGEGKPWCFTKASLQTDPASWEWESCDIPVCNRDCRRGNGNGDDTELPECQLIMEPNPQREAIVSVLSRGGVGPGDRVDLLDADVIMATCASDGRLLLPDMPVKAAPLQMLRMAFSGLHAPLHPHAFNLGEIWTTQTTLNDRYVYPLIFTSEVAEKVQSASWRELGLTDSKLENSDKYILYSQGAATWFTLKAGEAIVLPKQSPGEVWLLYLSPVWKLKEDVEVALLGEMNKFVPISRERIKGLSFEPYAAVVELQVEGGTGEHLSMSFVVTTSISSKLMACPLIIGADGRGRLKFHAETLSCS